MNWTLILSIAVSVAQALMENCPQNAAEERRGILRSPQERHKRRFEVRMKREATNPWTGCMTRAEWRQNEEEILAKCYAEAAAMSDPELDQLLAA